jgi:hypothetical protein
MLDYCCVWIRAFKVIAQSWIAYAVFPKPFQLHKKWCSGLPLPPGKWMPRSPNPFRTVDRVH